MNIIHYSIRSFFTNEYYSIIRFASKRLFVATLITTNFSDDEKSPDATTRKGGKEAKKEAKGRDKQDPKGDPRQCCHE